MFDKRYKKMFTVAVASMAAAGVLSGCSAGEIASGILRGMTQTSETSQTPQTADEIVDNSVKYNLYVVNCNQSISLRTEPSTSASEIMQIALGVQVGYIDSAANGFYKNLFDAQWS